MNSRLQVLLFLCAMTAARAQDSIRHLDYVRYDLNRISYSSDSSCLNRFFKKIQAAERGSAETIRIVHIGGSHVQGGMWSNTIAKNIQEKLNGKGGGYFCFPYHIGKTNGQPFVSSSSTGKWKLCRTIGKQNCRPVGLSAVSVRTSDSLATFSLALTGKSIIPAITQIRLFYERTSSYAVELATPAKSTREEHPEAGYTGFYLDNAADSVTFRVIRQDSSAAFILYGVSLESQLSPGVWLAPLGANGASTSSFLLLNEMRPQLAALHGDLFILSLGVNDAQSKAFTQEDFAAKNDSLISIIRSVAPDAAILLTTTSDNYIRRKTPNKRTAKARDAMFELMQKRHVAVWDLYGIMGGFKSMSKWNRSGLASRDKVHFSPAGYTIVGNLLFQALMRSCEKSAGR